MKDWRARVQQYGALGLGVWFAIFFSSIAGFYVLLEAGVEWPWLRENVGSAGSLAAAYVVTKLLTPARAALTVALTPLVARFSGRWRQSPVPAPDAAASASAELPPSAPTP